MNSTLTKQKSAWHGYKDNAMNWGRPRPQEEREKYVIFQERDLNYRFSLHQHPYVKKLTQELIKHGVSGLQALDTLNAETNLSLPFGTEVIIDQGKNITVDKGVRIVLVKDVTAELPGDMECSVVSNAEAETTEKVIAILVNPIACLQDSSSNIKKLEFDSPAIIRQETKINLPKEITVALSDGTRVSLPDNTAVKLLRESQVVFPKDTKVQILSSKPRPALFADFFDSLYKPNPELVRYPYPIKDLDFSSGGAYSIYNWELFFHAPLTVANHLSKNQRFADAQRWLHYLFDPTDDSDGSTSERFWKVRPFQQTDIKKIEEILVNLSTGTDSALQEETIRCFEAWMDAPFRPHVIARFRHQAYMYKTVMAYLDNLVAWGDSLFRQDTGEAIDEATQLYVMAANILGPRPQPVPKKGSIRPQTYANLRKDLRQFGTAIRQLEADLPFDLMPVPSGNVDDNAQLVTLRNMGKALYFCVPRNEKMLGYWDTVADRLFKIRNSLNIKGVFRQLALFEPPIDPAMLARAAAAGVDVGAIMNGRNQPLPLVRFQLLAQKASEIIQEVKSLGNNLLSAMEKEDGEAMAILRARHERMFLDMVEQVKYAQLQEAKKAKEGVLASFQIAKHRYTYYELQLNKTQEEIDATIPDPKDYQLDKSELDNFNFNTEEPEIECRPLRVNIASDLNEKEEEGKTISSYEKEELSKLEEAHISSSDAADKDKNSALLSYIPDFATEALPWGIGAAITIGGSLLSKGLSFLASCSRTEALKSTHEESKSSKWGSVDRREQENIFQSNLAALELNQIFKQLCAAQLREAIAEKEWQNHQQQIKNAQEIEYFLSGEKNPDWTKPIDPKEKKITNKAFYSWLKREVKGLYAQCFQFAFDITKKAERALQHELGNPELNYIEYGYLAGKEGLLAGEKLYLDLKRMEMAYHDLNQREYELTKNVSLLQVNPPALIQLRATGRCAVALPEELFDMDCPGHYFRRIKSVAVSIPCVTGPYTSINCTLTLHKSRIRTSSALVEDQYARQDAEDERFSDYFGSMQSIVTSTAQNDSGLFETNLRDERYLPFENSGVISEWQLELPANPSKDQPMQFDYNTISDVVLHIRYTAREGGHLLRNGALSNLTTCISNATMAGSVRLFSIRHEFPTEWANFKDAKIKNENEDGNENETAELTLNISEAHYPFWSKDWLKNVKKVQVFARTSTTDIEITSNQGKAPDSLNDNSLAGIVLGELANNLPNTPIGKLTLYFSDNSMDDLWLAVTWGKQDS